MIDYEKSSLALISSILGHYGYNNHHPRLAVLDQYLKRRPKNVVLLILDGLGAEILRRHRPNGFLARHQIATISAVFPPTTVAAINTLTSGLAPIEHGWLGWSLYFKEFERFIDIFPYNDSLTGEKIKLAPGNGKDLLAYENVFSKIKAATNDAVKRYVVHPEMIPQAGPDYEVLYGKNFEEEAIAIAKLTKIDEEKFIYAYFPEPDSSMHVLGTGSPEVGETIASLENTIENRLGNLKDTLVIISADHGLIDISEHIDIGSIPELFDCLKIPPSIEPRCTTFMVKEGMHAQFASAFKQRLGDDFRLLSKAEVRSEQIFGPGSEHPKVDDFLGDFLSIATGSKTIIYQGKVEKASFSFKAHHAGITADETNVPLILLLS